MKNASCYIWTKRTAQLIVVFAILLVLFGLGCSSVSPKLQDEYIRDNVSEGFKAVINDSRQSVQKFMTDGKVPGVSAALVDRDDILWSAGFGHTDKSQKTPVTTETIFGIMSITKLFTKTAVMFAVQDGLVELDVPIVEYLPDFSINSRFEENPQNKITLRHLLTHTSGLTFDTTVGNGGEMKSVSFEDHIKSISNTWLRHEVGQKLLYSNIGMDLAAYVLQIRTGKPYRQYLSEKLFKPLNMSNSTMELARIKRDPKRTKGHQPHVKEAPLGIVDFFLGAGSAFSSANDMARFIQFQLNRGQVGQRSILGEKFIDMMYTPSRFLYPKKGPYGNARPILPNDSGDGESRKFGHDGGGLGFCAYSSWYPEHGLGALILTNASLAKGNGAEVWINSITKRIISEKLVERNELFDKISWKTIWTVNSSGLDPNTFTPYQPDWKKYVGTYRLKWNGYQPYAYAKIMLAFLGYPEFEAQVYEKDGYLEILWQNLHWRLDEYRPGLFFTKEGECLDLRGEIPTWQNYRMDKIK